MKKELKIILTLVLCIGYIFSIQLKAQNNRFNDGDIDTSFGNNGFVVTGHESGFPNSFSDFALQPDGKIVAVGLLESQPIGQILVIRYNADGSLDTAFGTNGKVTYLTSDWTYASTVAIQSDGKIVVSGHQIKRFDGTGDFTDALVVRFNPDGSLDTGFGINGIVTIDFAVIEGYSTETFYKILLQSNGKIIAVGKSVKFLYPGICESYFSLVRLNQDGSFDETFGNYGKVSTPVGLGIGNSLGINNDVLNAEIQSDGKILVGTAPNYKATTPTSLEIPSTILIIRYNSDGTQDKGFSNGGSLEYLGGANFRAIRVRKNGKILAIATYNVLKQFEYNGNLDLNFSIGRIPFGRSEVLDEDLRIADNGQIIVAGHGYKQNIGWIAVLHRHNINGALDSTFGTEGVVTLEITGQNPQFRRVLIQPDGKILAAGYTYSDTGGLTIRFLIARFLVNNQIKATSKSKN